VDRFWKKCDFFVLCNKDYKLLCNKIFSNKVKACSEGHKMFIFWSFLSFLGAFDSHNYSSSAVGNEPGVACSNILAFDAVL